MKKHNKKIMQFGMGIIGLSATADAVGGLNNAASSQGSKAMQNAAKYIPAAGGIIGAGLTFGALRELQKTAKKFKK